MTDLQEIDMMDISTSNFVTESDSQNIVTEYLESDSDTMFDKVLRSGQQKGSSVWKYFEQFFDQKEQKDFIYCKLCLKNDKTQRYQPSTATTNLMKHLKNHHRTELMKEVGLEMEQPELKRTYIKTSTVWKYFCKLTKNEEIIDQDHIYCAKCLEMNINKKYKTTTSTGSLKKHLQLYHNIPPAENDEEIDMQGQAKGPRHKMSKARRYFHKLRSDQNHYYCLLCLHQKKYQKYCISTSTTALRTHLKSKHKIQPDTTDCPSFIFNIIAAIQTGNFDLNELSEPDTIQNNEMREPLIEELNDSSSMIEYVEEETDTEEFELMEVAPPQILSEKALEPKLVIKYCRACGKPPKGCFTKLAVRFEDDETPQMTLGALYLDVIGIKPKETSPMSVVCYECEAKLKLAFKFKQLALKTEKAMMEKLEYGVVVTEVTSEKCYTDDSFEDINEEIDEENSIDMLEDSFSESNLSTEALNDEETESLDLENSELLSVVSDIVAVPVNALNPKTVTNPRKSHGKSKTVPILVSHVGDEESETELEYCDRRFDPETPLETLQQDLKCDNCEIVIDTYDLLLTHNRETHGNAFPYKAVCHKRFASPMEIESHMKFMHETKTCDTCHLDFVNQEQFKLHSIIHDTSTKILGLQLAKCDECNVSFASEHSHLLHMTEHNRIYSCHHCSAKFKERKQLAVHMRRRHKFTCETCRNSYATLKILEIHERSHSGLRPFKCDMCPKSLVSEEGLKVHLKYVHKAFGNTDKTCEICNKTFTSKNGFIRHYRIHTGEFVECTYGGCGKKFTTNFNLKKHIELVHEDVRAYQCCECPKRYKSNAHLTKHVETEHLKLRFVCPLCNKTITSRWDFNHHVKRVHPDNLDTKPNEISTLE